MIDKISINGTMYAVTPVPEGEQPSGSTVTVDGVTYLIGTAITAPAEMAQQAIEKIQVNGVLYDIADVEAVEAETRRAMEAERMLSDAINANANNLAKAEKNIANQLFTTPDTVKVTITGCNEQSMRLNFEADIPAATEEKAGVMTADDRKKLNNLAVEGTNTDLNTYFLDGVYYFYSKRLTNVPILNDSVVSARLTVLAAYDGTSPVITQVLNLNNLSGGEGNVYIRSHQNGTWKPWGKLQTNINVETVDNLDNLKDNGIYSGVWTKGSYNAYPLTFVCIVINDYIVGIAPRRISQFVYGLSKLNGTVVYQTRVWDDSKNTWGDWEILNQKEISSMISNEIKKVTDGVDPEKLDSLKDLITWVDTHGGEVAGIKSDIQANEVAIETESERAMEAEETLANNLAETEKNIANQLVVTPAADKVAITGCNEQSMRLNFEADIPAATAEKAGVMTAEDKGNLEGLYVKHRTSNLFDKKNYSIVDLDIKTSTQEFISKLYNNVILIKLNNIVTEASYYTCRYIKEGIFVNNETSREQLIALGVKGIYPILADTQTPSIGDSCILGASLISKYGGGYIDALEHPGKYMYIQVSFNNEEDINNLPKLLDWLMMTSSTSLTFPTEYQPYEVKYPRSYSKEDTYSKKEVDGLIEVSEKKVAQRINNVERTVFETEKREVKLDIISGYYYNTFSNGALTNDNSRCCSDIVNVNEGEVYYVTTNIGGSGIIAYLAQWNGDAWVGIADDFKANSGNAVEREYVVPEGVTHIAVCSYNTTPPTLTKQVVGDSTTFYTKDEVYTKKEVGQLVGDKSAVKIYGVRNNLADPSLTTWERTGDAVGMVASVEKHNVAAGMDDFLDVYPFNAIRECNIETLENGATKITYKGEPGFSLTDKDVFVEFPLWYERRYIKDGYEYREICAQQAGGFYPSPMFIEDGRVLDRVYIAKYETSLVDGVACSKSGEEPLTYKTVAEFRELYKTKGSGYAGMDIRTVMSLQHLYLVRFAQKNTQNYIGGGYTDLYQPWGYAAKDYSGTVGGEVMVKNYVKTYPANSTFNDLKKVHWVGKQIGFVKSNESSLYDRATITDMVVSEDGKQYTIYFDKEVEIITEAAGSPANSDSSPVRTWFGGCGQDTGATDSLVHDTGSTALAVANNKGSCAVKLFGLENMWGNVWHELDGIIFKGEYAFIGFSQKDYNNNADGYIPVAHQMLEQATLGRVGAQFCFIGNMWIDNAYPWVAYPQAVRGGSPTDITRYTDGVNENSSYGDAYYFDSSANGGVSVEVHGGGFDHYERAGLFCHRCWNGINFKWYLQGSRMQFKML